jgi:D-threo-aldose 1-dehydrogenase
LHDPDDHYRQALEGAFPALEQLRHEGAITSYGAGTNQSAMLADFVRHTDLDIVMLADRYTLLEQGALDDLLPLCLERQVSVIAAGVFNSGLLASDRPGHDATYNYAPASAEHLDRANRIASICEQFGTTLPDGCRTVPAGPPGRGQRLPRHGVTRAGRRNAVLFDTLIPFGLWRALKSEGLLQDDGRLLEPEPAAIESPGFTSSTAACVSSKSEYPLPLDPIRQINGPVGPIGLVHGFVHETLRDGQQQGRPVPMPGDGGKAFAQG